MHFQGLPKNMSIVVFLNERKRGTENRILPAIFRICICHNEKSVNFKSIILYEKIFVFTKLFHSDVNKPFKLSYLVFVDLQMQSSKYKLLFRITWQSASNQFPDMLAMLFPRTVPSFEYSL